MSNLYLVEVSPHIKSSTSTQRVMLDVIIALIPALIMSGYIFGMRAIIITLISIAICVAAEYLFCKITRRASSISNLSAIVTGILFAFCLPPGTPYFIVIIGAFVSIILGKAIFGGIGHNPFNPALVGRAFLLASWPVAITTWYKPFWYKGMDVITTATPLAISSLHTNGNIPSYFDMFIGVRSGCIGETSILALLIGAIYLIAKGIIKLHIPLAYIATVALGAFLFKADPLFHIMAGGLILGAFFMATDYSTSPLDDKAKIIFGIGTGILTVLIRFKAALPEGVCYSILVMNMFTPLLDKYIQPKRYGVNGGRI